jgi:hypothetical protein
MRFGLMQSAVYLSSGASRCGFEINRVAAVERLAGAWGHLVCSSGGQTAPARGARRARVAQARSRSGWW